MRVLIFAVMLLATPVLAAAPRVAPVAGAALEAGRAPHAIAVPFGHRLPGQPMAQDLMRPGPQGLLPNPRKARIGNQQAAARVRDAYADHKILSVQLIEGKGPPVYRIKALSDSGIVRYIFVDGTSGDVFE